MKPLDAMKASFTAGARNWLAVCIFGIFLVVAAVFRDAAGRHGLVVLLPSSGAGLRLVPRYFRG